MIPERWQQVKELFHAALERAPEERSAFLDAACGGDETLRREIESLVEAHHGEEDYLDGPAYALAAEVLADGGAGSLVGRSLGHYRVISLLGSGGMGEVYLAEDTLLGRKVALKLLPEAFTRDEGRLRRFEREARAASALNHPNILTIHEVGRVDSAHYIATEFIDGVTLRERLDEAPMKLDEALDVAAQIASALAAAHEAGVVHRDVKPENVMLRRRDRIVKVLDFGMAKLAPVATEGTASDPEVPTRTRFRTHPGEVMGTVAYMSPEQIRGLDVDARADIWSLGVVLYEMVAGHAPFRADTDGDLIVQILDREPARLGGRQSRVQAELQRVVSKALRKERGERYQTAGDMVLNLKGLRRRLESEDGAGAVRQGGTDESDGGRDAAPQDDLATSASPAGPPTNLTAELPRLIGREREVTAAKALLRRKGVRLLTLTGVGGSGKTRLAQQVARELLAEFSGGVFFIDLSPVVGPDLVPSAVAQALGVKEAGGRPLIEDLKEHLRARQTLLVLDNFEQVVDAAPIVTGLLSSAPRLKALVTSRALLRLSPEHEFGVPPLTLPDANRSLPAGELIGYAAVALFVERARAAKPDFRLTEENAQDVAEICARLDGLPLAIELAAVRVKFLPERAILTRLENRLKLLTGGARDLPARQQTMRAAISWSYDLLGGDERRLLSRLSVFSGGCTLEAAEEVCGAGGGLKAEVLDGVTSLVDKSLLTQKEQADGEHRFRMLEVVREYALEKFSEGGEAEEVRRRHALFYLGLAEAAEPELSGARQAEWLGRLEEEHDNLRAALDWTLRHEAEYALRLAGALRRLWQAHSHLTKGREWLEAALERGSRLATPARAEALIGAGILAKMQGDFAASYKFCEECLRVSREIDDKRRVALACNGLAAAALQAADYKTARHYLEESLAIGREMNDERLVAIALTNLGEAARGEGDFNTARSLYGQGLAVFRQGGFKENLIIGLASTGAMAYAEGDYKAALSYYTEVLAAAEELGSRMGNADGLDGFAALAATRGEWSRAARLAGAADAQRELIGYKMTLLDREFRDRYLSEVRKALGEESFSAAEAEGRSMRMNEAIALALGTPPAARM